MWKLLAQITKLQRRSYASNVKPKNHYESLGIASNSTQSEVKSAYYKLSMQHHPDKNQGNEESLQKFRDISEAYEVLSNVSTRKLYDRGLYINKDQPHEYDKPTVNKFYKSRVTRSQPPTTTGSVPIYDFDEWARNHYGKIFEKRQENKKKMKEYLDMKTKHKDAQRVEGVLFGMLLILFICASIKTSFDYDRVMTKPNKSGTYPK